MWAIAALPDPVSLIGLLTRDPGRSIDQALDALLLTVAAVLSWGVAAWVLVVIVVGLLAAIATRDLRAVHAAVGRLVPRTARGLVITAIGLGAAAALTGCAPGAVAADAPAATSDASLSASAAGSLVLDLDWPRTMATSPLGTSVPNPPPTSVVTSDATSAGSSSADQPAAPASASSVAPPMTRADPAPAPPAPVDTAAGPQPRPGRPPATVVVKPGDSLWAIAAAHLPAGHSDVDVALAWPAWYAANQDLIGDNPDEIRPGWALVVPTSALEETR
jgi:hypothetical protein